MAEKQPAVIVSYGNDFAGPGMGTIAFHNALGLHRHGLLHSVLCGSSRTTPLPPGVTRSIGVVDRALRKLASLDTSNWLWYLQAEWFDLWALRYLKGADLLHVWCGYGTHSLKRAKAAGTLTVSVAMSTHPLFQNRLLCDEYARWGQQWKATKPGLQRAVNEMQRADYVLVPSDIVRESCIKEGVDERKIIQVPFGVDVNRFAPAEREKDRPFRAVFVGQIGIRKGVPYLLEAWKRLQWRDAELWLVGRVLPEVQALLAQYRELPGVRLIGFMNGPARAYQEADVFVFPSIEEGSALVTYEALACGLPVITTPNAGSVVQDGVEGFLVPARDVDALAARMEQLRADEPLRATMGKAARARAMAFTWEHHGDRLAATYTALYHGSC